VTCGWTVTALTGVDSLTLALSPSPLSIECCACRSPANQPVNRSQVMAGLYRLGAASAGLQYLRVAPDIACFAKLMTAGVAPMAATLASERWEREEGATVPRAVPRAWLGLGLGLGLSWRQCTGHGT
jgi:hypothetical protein